MWQWRGPATSFTRSSVCAGEQCLPSLDAFLASGGRKVDAWYGALAHVEVAFDDQPDAFANLNTTEALRALELKLKLP